MSTVGVEMTCTLTGSSAPAGPSSAAGDPPCALAAARLPCDVQPHASPEQGAPPATLPRSRMGAQPGDILAFAPGTPAIGDVCVTHPLAGSHVRAARRCLAEGTDRRKRDKYGCAGVGGLSLVPPSHETYGRVGPPAFAFLNRP